MAPTVFPFPIIRRRAFIRKQALHVALINPEAGVRYLQHQLDIQTDVMRRRGISENLVQRELGCMRRAIQAELAGNVLQTGR